MVLFDEFVKKYDLNDPDISYKYKHTYRVKAFCEMLAKELGLTQRETYIASLCGIFHDIARFEQDKRYDSFSDTSAFDHGDVGYEVFLNLFADKLDITEEEKMIIARSILYHNKIAIGKCNENELLFCKLIRDADKLDILYAVANNVMRLDELDGDISEKCYEFFLKRQTIPRAIITNNAEEVMIKLAFIWDINFKESLDIIKKEKYYEKIKNRLNNSKYDRCFEEISKYLEEC